jgi:transposase-like protein
MGIEIKEQVTLLFSDVSLSPLCNGCKQEKLLHVMSFNPGGKIENAWWFCKKCDRGYGLKTNKKTGDPQWSKINRLRPSK